MTASTKSDALQAADLHKPLAAGVGAQAERMKLVQVALDSGETIAAYKTNCGELAAPTCGEASAEWIVPLEKKLTVVAGKNCCAPAHQSGQFLASVQLTAQILGQAPRCQLTLTLLLGSGGAD